FVKFLIDTFGVEKLKELCIATQSAGDFDQTIPGVYGYTIDELEAQLRSYLAQRNTPEVAFTIPPDAELVFSMPDPVGDDTGDGDYVYPRHKWFAKGVFDLRKFEVLKDSSRAYFRLAFQNMMQPLSYGSSTERFASGVVIAIKKTDSDGRHVQRFCHGVQFEEGEGYDLKLNVGLAVSAANNFGKVYFSTPDVYEKISNRETKTIAFSLPIEFIGEPENNWKYFVGVGLVSDRTMNFLHAGPFSVYKKHPVFISGGNFEYGNPAFIDILLPENADQAKLLSDYDAEKGMRATVPMLGTDDWVRDAKKRGVDVVTVKKLQTDFRQLRKGIEKNEIHLSARKSKSFRLPQDHSNIQSPFLPATQTNFALPDLMNTDIQ
ncbi:MAG: glucodextranase DOMON-like domain-containing protein, partial [bacterium]